MKNRVLYCILCLCCFTGVGFADELTKKSLVIMIDGMRSDALYNAVTPNIDSIINETWADGYSTSWTYGATTLGVPSSTTNHVSIATGVAPAKHLVTNNGVSTADNYTAYPTYISRLEEANAALNTAFFYCWYEDFWMPDKAKTAFDYSRTRGFSASYDKDLVAEAVSMINGTSTNQTASVGTWTGVANNPGGWQTGSWTAGTDPDAIMLYIEGVDPIGHGSGFSAFNAPYVAGITAYDNYVGQLLSAIKSRSTFDQEDWQIVIVSDHGGIGGAHGVTGCNNCETIPLIATSRTMASGEMAGTATSADPAAYVLNHMLGTTNETMANTLNMDGQLRSVKAAAPVALDANLLHYYAFDGDLTDSVGTNHAEAKNVAGYSNPVQQAAGNTGGAAKLEIGNYLSLGNPTDMQFGENGDFTFTLWINTDSTQTFLPILGNKNWANGSNQGVQLAANYAAANAMEWNLGNGSSRHDLKELNTLPGEWNFISVTADRDGNTFLYVGHADGTLAFIADGISALGDITAHMEAAGYTWNIGQDGTGAYNRVGTSTLSGFPGLVDDLGVWGRSLTTDEVNLVFQRGLEGFSLGRILDPQTAGEQIWNAGVTGDWAEGGNWESGVAPSPGDTAIIRSGTVNFTDAWTFPGRLQIEDAGANVVFDDLTKNATLSSGSLAMTDGVFSVKAADFRLGSGYLNDYRGEVSGGKFTSESNRFILGASEGAKSELIFTGDSENLIGGASSSENAMFIGFDGGEGVLTATGNSVNRFQKYTQLGTNGSTGTINLLGNSTNTFTTTVLCGTMQGEGTINIGDTSTNTFSGDLYVGDDGPSSGLGYGTGTLNVTGGTTTVAGRFGIGYTVYGDGTANISGGEFTANGYVGIGYSTGTGVMTLSGGINKFTRAAGTALHDRFTVGQAGTGTLIMEGDSVNTISGYFGAGLETGGDGTVILRGDSTNTFGSYTLVGAWLGTGRMFIEGNSTNTIFELYVGDDGPGTGQGYATGYLTVTGGNTTNTGTFYVGHTTNSTGYATLAGGQFRVNGNTVIGQGNAQGWGDGTLTLAGGTHTFNAMVIGDGTAASTGKLIISGGTNSIVALTLGNSGSTGRMIVTGGTGTTTIASLTATGAGATVIFNPSGGSMPAVNVTGDANIRELSMTPLNGFAFLETDTFADMLTVGGTLSGAGIMADGATQTLSVWDVSRSGGALSATLSPDSNENDKKLEINARGLEFDELEKGWVNLANTVSPDGNQYYIEMLMDATDDVKLDLVAWMNTSLDVDAAMQAFTTDSGVAVWGAAGASHFLWDFSDFNAAYPGANVGVTGLFGQEVPEPATWLMLILGVLGMGVMRKKSQKTA